MTGRKNTIKKARARGRSRTAKQRAQDDKFWACGRKVQYATQGEANEVADRLGHTAYKCELCFGFHTAHLPGSRRFVRGVAA